jgi:hypothetical protein
VTLRFKVWDELNSSEDAAEELEEFDAQDAAEEYARGDNDGLSEGLYTEDGGAMSTPSRDGYPIMVRCPDGKLLRFRVAVTEFTPVFSAFEAPLEDVLQLDAPVAEAEWPRYSANHSHLSPEMLSILHHAIGVSKVGRFWTAPYRNKFVAPAGADNHVTCEGLVKLDYMGKRYEGAYYVTNKGLEMIGYRAEERIV